jgi:hypothetical protein
MIDMDDYRLIEEDEELLEALSKIDDEQVKNIIIGYIENIKKPKDPHCSHP